jgi:hypothetical protein
MMTKLNTTISPYVLVTLAFVALVLGTGGATWLFLNTHHIDFLSSKIARQIATDDIVILYNDGIDQASDGMISIYSETTNIPNEGYFKVVNGSRCRLMETKVYQGANWNNMEMPLYQVKCQGKIGYVLTRYVISEMSPSVTVPSE